MKKGSSFLCRWAVVYPLIALCLYFALISTIILIPSIQPYLIYLHWIPFPTHFLTSPEHYGFRADSVRNFRFNTSDGVELGAWHVFPRAKHIPVLDYHSEITSPLEGIKGAKRVLVYFHGNAGNRGQFHRTDFYKRMTSLSGNTHLIAIDYRGFGDSQYMLPDEIGVQKDAISTFEYLNKVLGVFSEKIILVGHSLGSGVATFLARHLTIEGTKFGGLILVSGYTSISDAAMGYPMVPLLYPFKDIDFMRKLVRKLMTDKWTNDAYFGGSFSGLESDAGDTSVDFNDGGGIDAPVCILHGKADFEIPALHSQRLFLQAIKGKHYLKTKKALHLKFPLETEPKEVWIDDSKTFAIRPVGREGFLWTSIDEKSVFYLEVTHAGHNTLGHYEIMSASSTGNNIRVVCRFRPQNKREIAEGGEPVTDFDEDFTTVKFQSKEYPGNFTFDKVFHWETSQAQMFDYTAAATIEDVMKGYNGTIFAYGQTGSGKTHTMMGDMESELMRGLTPRLVESIFQSIFDAPSNLEFTVKVSFLEIYMERIKDLLNPANDNLPIHEEKSKGVYVKGLMEVFVGSVDEVFEAMMKGQSARVTASTNMNAESSRSHSIFILHVQQKDLNTGSIRNGKLSLVDLAGSEKIGKTGATGQTLEEAKKINKSLSALGMVINALTDGKSSHIPYRDSKLTRILQESLGGNSRTTLIINCSPSSFNEAETISTLRFGMRAKTIKNKAKVNAELNPNELKALLKKAKIEITELQKHIDALGTELNIWRTGGSVPEEEYVTFENFPSIATPVKEFVDNITARSQTPASQPISADERDEFLKRENDLTDQLEEKEAELLRQKNLLDQLQSELDSKCAVDFDYEKENQKLNSMLGEVKIQLEKTVFENKEGMIVLDSLKDANSVLTREIQTLKRALNQYQSRSSNNNTTNLGKEKIKQEKIAKLMAKYDASDVISEQEKEMRDTLNRLAYMSENSTPPTLAAEVEKQHRDLWEAKSQLTNQQNLVSELKAHIKLSQTAYEDVLNRNIELDEKVNNYEEILSNASKGNVDWAYELKNKVEVEPHPKIEELNSIVSEKNLELEALRLKVSNLEETNANLLKNADTVKATNKGTALTSSDITRKEEELENMRKTMAKQLADFDNMKKKLMKDLQNRCERVVELEISLEESKEAEKNSVRNANSVRANQERMSMVERNLDQLTIVQKQLVENNTALKKEMVLADRKLSTRNERIQNLESLLQELQFKLETQNEKYEKQIISLKEKLHEAKSQHAEPASSSSWLYSSRIAKPLRGHGAETNNEEPISAIQKNNSVNTPTSKRSSWYISLLKK